MKAHDGTSPMCNFIRLAYDNYIANLFHCNKHEESIRCGRKGKVEERELLISELEMVRGGMPPEVFREYRENLLNYPLNHEIGPHFK
jgi:hypothetical protein